MAFTPKTEKALTCGYEYTPLFYSTPCKVRFYDSLLHGYDYGIAIYNVLIRERDGFLITLEAVMQQAENDGVFWDDAIIELDWNSYTYNR